MHFNIKTISLPIALQRQLSRLVGLFEIGDEEFISIRNKHNELTEKFNQLDDEELLENAIDILSLDRYLVEFKIVNEMYAQALAAGFTDYKDSNENPSITQTNKLGLDSLIELCNFVRLSTIGNLNTVLETHRKNFKQIFTGIIERSTKKTSESKTWIISKAFAINLLVIYDNTWLFHEQEYERLSYKPNFIKTIYEVQKQLEEEN